MEAEIKRVSYFDGQFLKQQEFNEDSFYDRHMRRRINYVLFNQSGVLQLDSDDLTIEALGGATDKRIRILAGTALSLDADIMEGKEIVLRDNTAPIDLTTQGIGAGATAWVTVSYDEQAILPEASDFGGNFPSRVTEQPRVAIFAALPAPGADGKRRHPATNDELIILGNVAFDTMMPSSTSRQTARLRSVLVGAVTGATISSIDLHTLAQGGTATATISGTNLAGATAVTFSGTGVTATINGSTATTVTITLTATATATLGPRDFTVATPAGNASSTGVGGANFQITPPAPIILPNVPGVSTTEFSPGAGNATTTVFIYGRNFDVDAPTNPTVQVVNTTGTTVLNTFNVAAITSGTSGGVPYQRLEGRVGTVSQTVPTNGRMRITTSGGSATSTGTFTLLP